MFVIFPPNYSCTWEPVLLILDKHERPTLFDLWGTEMDIPRLFGFFVCFFCKHMLWLLALSLSLVTIGDAQDPYYQMEAHNLNTMNSYFIPTDSIPRNVSWNIDIANYVHFSKDLTHPEAVLTNADPDSNRISVLHLMSSYIGIRLQILILAAVAIFIRRRPESKFAHILAMWFEGIYEFFEWIIGEEKPKRMKNFVTWLFFTILVANMIGRVNDIARFFFPWLLRNITGATWELEFNLALAIVATVVILYAQGKALGWPMKLAHEYLPVTWKWLMPDNKIGDIVISLFIGILDIIGVFARIISLSLRLFWNMSSGSILLNVTFLGLWAVTVWALWMNLAIWLPLIVYLQWILSVVIQAFVFSLIVSISLKMATE